MNNKETQNWGEKLKQMGILWQHNGESSQPHALWTSGLHANTFNNSSKLIEDPKILKEVINGITKILKTHKDYKKPDWVVGPALGAVTIGYEMARQLETKFAFTEPVKVDGKKMQILKRFDIKPNDTVFVIEDAISTGGSIIKTISVLENINATVLPFVASVVNWSGSDKLGNKDIISLYSDKPKSWQQENCPLCENGSKALRPKSNWDKFTS